jgi:ABC-2 type transport system permease protein
MNGFGHVRRAHRGLPGVLGRARGAFALVANALWVRGNETGGKQRLALAWSTRSRASVAAGGRRARRLRGTGVFIFWNTNVRNEYTTSHEREARQADWRRRTRPRGSTYPSPDRSGEDRVRHLPGGARVTARGTYALRTSRTSPSRGRRARPARREDREAVVRSRRAATLDDERLGFYVYDLAAPLAPQEKATLDFEVSAKTTASRTTARHRRSSTTARSSTARRCPTSATATTTSSRTTPTVTSSASPRSTCHPPGIRSGRCATTAFPTRLDHFDATVSTSAGPARVAPGYLDREWTQDGRRYFHYAMDSKILGFYAFLSAATRC